MRAPELLCRTCTNPSRHTPTRHIEEPISNATTVPPTVSISKGTVLTCKLKRTAGILSPVSVNLSYVSINFGGGTATTFVDIVSDFLLDDLDFLLWLAIVGIPIASHTLSLITFTENCLRSNTGTALCLNCINKAPLNSFNGVLRISSLLSKATKKRLALLILNCIQQLAHVAYALLRTHTTHPAFDTSLTQSLSHDPGLALAVSSCKHRRSWLSSSLINSLVYASQLLFS
mmetsp:Transcript_8176/g.13206  ORF Transcript_8176/g.13206 Transcript_8176/m.13206 type:complete len:231 (-) Transcript_8176:303-995(-)